ncbi:hypothetical protein AA15669_1249 [Saccharibacter floricola DSM 15669]|uniref:Uncharacterized protein n=1 Tax=Saccharibacter floricola DSM 15669 TaxID=1123227 RepID=A0ABQ0P019_9PROT|nr:hypothetical protein AA15669_1249 [Saccharibacter floricola DSM 15669]
MNFRRNLLDYIDDKNLNEICGILNHDSMNYTVSLGVFTCHLGKSHTIEQIIGKALGRDVINFVDRI